MEKQSREQPTNIRHHRSRPRKSNHSKSNTKERKRNGHTVTSEPTEKIDTLPIAKNITISGELKVGKTLTANYEYEDAE